MKKAKVLIMLVLFLGVAISNLFAQYLNVGDDPEKIEIASTKKITYKGKWVGGYAWSHDGEWFLGANNDGWYIMDKNGNFLQKIPRKALYFKDWIFPNNKQIFYTFQENNKEYYAIYSLQTKKETILPIDHLKEHYIDISPEGDILFYKIVRIAKKAYHSFFLYNPENGSRIDLGMMALNVCTEDNDNRYLGKERFLVRIYEKNNFKIKKYNFKTKEFSKTIVEDSSKPSYLQLHDGRQVIAVTDGWDMVYLYEESGILLGKFRSFFDRGESDQYGNCDDLIPGYNSSDRELAPNGKLIFLRMHKTGDQESGDLPEVYLYNFQGRYVRFKPPFPIGEIKWSPQGDRILNGDLIVYLRKKN